MVLETKVVVETGAELKEMADACGRKSEGAAKKRENGSNQKAE